MVFSLRLAARRLVVLVFTLLCSAGALADTIDVSDAWARPTFALATTGAAYITLQNKGAVDDRLVDVSVSESVARKAEIHDHMMEGDVMKMRHLEEGVVVAANSSVSFAPGGKHIMLMGLTGPLEEGQTIEVTLTFEKSAPQVISVAVGDVEKQDADTHHHHH